MTSPLLPTGCYDVLFPDARAQTALAEGLLVSFESFGYRQVSPSLLEYSENLLAAGTHAISEQIFRVMDGTSHKVMGIRPDITLQISRLVSTRMADSPLPLRVCYNGQVLRMQPQHNMGRQLRQTGIELVGAGSPEADAEIIIVAATALKEAGIAALSIDLNLPGIVTTMLAGVSLNEGQLEQLTAAINYKDISSIQAMKLDCGETLTALINAAGPARTSLKAMQALDLPKDAQAQLSYLGQVIDVLEDALADGCSLTVDATEARGQTYHSGISFSIFAPSQTEELGRGGRYTIETAGGRLPATGFTLYIEHLRGIAATKAEPARIFIARDTNIKHIATLRSASYAVVKALGGQPFTEAEARRMQCTYIYINDEAKELSPS